MTLPALAPLPEAAPGSCVATLTPDQTYAEDVKLPPTMTMTAYDTGTAGFNIPPGDDAGLVPLPLVAANTPVAPPIAANAPAAPPVQPLPQGPSV